MAVNLSGLTETQVKTLRGMLDKKLAALESEIKELEATLTDAENNDKSAPDEVDRSSFEEEMQRIQLVLDGRKTLQYEVMAALKRMEEGNYGICEETEEPIGYKRLAAQPWTRLSLEAQQDFENRKRNRSGGGGAFPSGYDSGGGGSSEEASDE